MDVAYCSSQKIIRDGSSKKILELQLVERNDPMFFWSFFSESLNLMQRKASRL